MRIPKDAGEWLMLLAAAALLAAVVFAALAALQPGSGGHRGAAKVPVVMPAPRPARVVPL